MSKFTLMEIRVSILGPDEWGDEAADAVCESAPLAELTGKIESLVRAAVKITPGGEQLTVEVDDGL